MFASRWHSPPKPLPVLSCVTGHVQVREAVGVEASPARRPPARRRAGRRSRGRASTRSSSVVLPAPGRAHDVHDRHAVAVEVVAVGPRDRVVGVERVLDDPDPHAMHAASSSDTSIDSTSSSSPLSTATSARRRSAGSGTPGASISHSRSHAVAAQPRRDELLLQPRALAHASRARRSRTRSPASRARPGAGARSAGSRPSRAARRRGATAVSTTADAIENSCIRPGRRRRVRSSSSVSRHERQRALDGGLDRRRQAEADVVDLARLAADDDDLAGEAADRADEAQHRLRGPCRAG